MGSLTLAADEMCGMGPYRGPRYLHLSRSAGVRSRTEGHLCHHDFVSYLPFTHCMILLWCLQDITDTQTASLPCLM